MFKKSFVNFYHIFTIYTKAYIKRYIYTINHTWNNVFFKTNSKKLSHLSHCHK